jgi:hypothetical protein
MVVGAALALGLAGTARAVPPGGKPACQAALNTCNANLANCNAALAQAQEFPATGQTTVRRTGDDGAIQAGATLSYTDNGETIIDNNTGLEWEKKSDDGSINDKDTTYTWENAFAVHVAGLNTALFAGHNDWRLPNVKELQSIVNYENFSPSVSSAFNNSCDPGDTVTDGSCTAASSYWSSTSFAFDPTVAWFVDFLVGSVDGDGKGVDLPVRAVRGGL